MNRGFYTILAAQFFSAFADNALLFAAIALLTLTNAPSWHIPVLQQSFIISFIILAPFVGAFADSLPKGRVMLISNSLKMLGCIAMLLGVNPLLAYGFVGFGAAAYSPAKYGILTEYLPPEKLVLANSWMEGLTVLAIILGAVVGGILISPTVATSMLQWWNVPGIDTAPKLAISIILLLYSVAAIFNLYIPRLPIDHKPLSRDPIFLLKEFAHCFKLLWKDPLGQVSLAVTTLFWGAGASLRLILLAWAAVAFHYDISSAAKLTAWFALGIAIGSILAARFVKLNHAVNVLPVGIGMGVLVMCMPLITNPTHAIILLILMGAMGGFFVVPMNALLQHRGHLLMGAGSSIAVQNFNENISIFIMLALYAAMEKLGFSIYVITVVFGLLMAGLMGVLYRKHGHDQDNGTT
ncbi:MAG: lysophospholipid transporter LplT [Gallionellaceae bacterium]|nr:lysophospholipid transporter LplT [Gallionellaceae bacterium]